MDKTTYFFALTQMHEKGEPRVILLMQGGYTLQGFARNHDYGKGKLYSTPAAWFTLEDVGRTIGLGGYTVPQDIVIDVGAVIAVIPL
jgi:hypothetical protein